VQYLWLSLRQEKNKEEKDEKESQEKEIINPCSTGNQRHQPLLS